jgi:hypothetical protein
MSDRPPSRDVKTTSREIGPAQAPRLREPPGSIPNRGPEVRGDRSQRGVLDPGKAAPHTRHRTAHAQLCASVSGCRRVVFGYVTCHYPTGPDPTQQKQPRIARRTILMRGGGGVSDRI